MGICLRRHHFKRDKNQNIPQHRSYFRHIPTQNGVNKSMTLLSGPKRRLTGTRCLREVQSTSQRRKILIRENDTLLRPQQPSVSFEPWLPISSADSTCRPLLTSSDSPRHDVTYAHREKMSCSPALNIEGEILP